MTCQLKEYTIKIGHTEVGNSKSGLEKINHVGYKIQDNQ